MGFCSNNNFNQSGIVPISAARQSSSRTAAPASASKPINIVAPKPFVNVARPRPNAFHKLHSPSRLPFNQQTTLKNRNLNDKVNTAMLNSINTAKGNKVTSVVGEQAINAISPQHARFGDQKEMLLTISPKIGNPQYALQDHGIFNSGCSRHMTGNKFYLSDYQDIDGGFFAFGGSSKGEFDNKIKDRKGIENVAADHLSRIENDETSDDSEVDDNFHGETLMEINTKDEPWFADFANYLVSDIIPKGMTYQQKNKSFFDLKHYFWEEPYLFKVCSDGMIRRCVSSQDTQTILEQCHHEPTGGHYGQNTTAKKVLDSAFYWPIIIKEAHTQVRLCEACQKTGNISKHDEMPLNNISVCEIFDIWGIDFMGPFPKSYKFEYMLVAVDYVSKWAEEQTLPTNDARVVITFLKKLLYHFRMPKALISDRGTHFCKKIMEKTMKRYGVNHRFSTSYHPQTSGQVENTNKALNRILKKTVKDDPAIWSRNLMMLCGLFVLLSKHQLVPHHTNSYMVKTATCRLKLNTVHTGPGKL
ncbi:reverse transcriptase domain-containing protein [Tanacetum coccineum]|uniref:Reverse transcriptase domain-containing protein n=1 Tax=Tanacetum coccineum TaxID=301880 RepID=A0ABQ5HYT4_9ASTR